jgi:capsid protein
MSAALHTADPYGLTRQAAAAPPRAPTPDEFQQIRDALAGRDRRAAYAALVAAIRPGLEGAVASAVADLAPAVLLRAAVPTWTPDAPVTSWPTPSSPPRSAFRRTLVDLLPEVPARSVLRVPQISPPTPAAPRAVGAAKVDAALSFGPAVNAPLRSVATHITLTDELLEDGDQLGAWLEAYLEFLVALGEEKAVLRGVGGAADVLGFWAWPGIATLTGGGTSVARKLADAAGQASASGIEPDTYVLSYADWSAVLEDGDPTLDADASRLHGRDVVRTGALVAGQMLVGAVQTAAALGRTDGIRVEGTNSHDVEFAKDISRIRAESRVALAVLLPAAFVKVGA